MKNRISWTSCVLLISSVAAARESCVPDFRGTPEFAVTQNFGFNALTDLDSDGNLDLIIGLDLFLGDGEGGFRHLERLDAPIREAFDVRIADFDRDGRRDLAMVSFGSQEMIFFYGRDPEDGTGKLFEDAVSVDFSQITSGVWHIELGDFNNDDLPDLVGIARSGPNILILMNDGERKYTPRSLRRKSEFNHMLTTGDFNGDGNIDVCAGGGSDFSLFPGQGDGNFGIEQTGVLRHDLRNVSGHRFRAADLDGDGRSDLLATGEGSILIFLGKDISSTGGLPSNPSVTLDLSAIGRFLEVADLNFDGLPDIVTLANARADGSRYQVFVQEDTEFGVQFKTANFQATGLSGRGSVLAIGDVNGDDYTDIVLTTEDTLRARVFLNDAACPLPSIRAGDANLDSLVDISDVVEILVHLFLGGPLVCPEAAEVNGDGELDISDATYLIFHLFLGGTPPVGQAFYFCDVE